MVGKLVSSQPACDNDCIGGVVKEDISDGMAGLGQDIPTTQKDSVKRSGDN